MIYKSLFESTTFHITVYTTRPLEPGEYLSNKTLSLLQTCRQIHEEAKLLPFQLSTFSFSYIRYLEWLLESFTPHQRSLISSLEIVLSYWSLRPYWGRFHGNQFRMHPWRWDKMRDMIRLDLTGIKHIHVRIEMHKMPRKLIEGEVLPDTRFLAGRMLPGVEITHEMLEGVWATEQRDF
jgi:hypothetical protein